MKRRPSLRALMLLCTGACVVDPVLSIEVDDRVDPAPLVLPAVVPDADEYSDALVGSLRRQLSRSRANSSAALIAERFADLDLAPGGAGARWVFPFERVAWTTRVLEFSAAGPTDDGAPAAGEAEATPPDESEIWGVRRQAGAYDAWLTPRGVKARLAEHVMVQAPPSGADLAATLIAFELELSDELDLAGVNWVQLMDELGSSAQRWGAPAWVVVADPSLRPFVEAALRERAEASLWSGDELPAALAFEGVATRLPGAGIKEDRVHLRVETQEARTPMEVVAAHVIGATRASKNLVVSYSAGDGPRADDLVFALAEQMVLANSNATVPHRPTTFLRLPAGVDEAELLSHVLDDRLLPLERVDFVVELAFRDTSSRHTVRVAPSSSELDLLALEGALVETGWAVEQLGERPWKTHDALQRVQGVRLDFGALGSHEADADAEDPERLDPTRAADLALQLVAIARPLVRYLVARTRLPEVVEEVVEVVEVVEPGASEPTEPDPG